METTPDDADGGFSEELEAISRRPVDEQERWLLELESRFSEHPNKNKILVAARKLLASAGNRRAAELKFRHADEQTEAYLVSQVEELLNGSMKLPNNPEMARYMITQISLMGHRMPNLKERLAKPDAQKMIEDWFLEFIEQGPEK